MCRQQHRHEEPEPFLLYLPASIVWVEIRQLFQGQEEAPTEDLLITPKASRALLNLAIQHINLSAGMGGNICLVGDHDNGHAAVAMNAIE